VCLEKKAGKVVRAEKEEGLPRCAASNYGETPVESRFTAFIFFLLAPLLHVLAWPVYLRMCKAALSLSVFLPLFFLLFPPPSTSHSP
jgi:hypothetical protein